MQPKKANPVSNSVRILANTAYKLLLRIINARAIGRVEKVEHKATDSSVRLLYAIRKGFCVQFINEGIKGQISKYGCRVFKGTRKR